MKALVPILLCILLCGCGGGVPADAEPTPTPEPTPMVLTVSMGAEGSTIDPSYRSPAESGDLLNHLFEGLVKYAPAEVGETVNAAVPVLGLAESMELSEDGTVLRFTIRSDAYWSDGVPVTAADFVYAWGRLLTPVGEGEPRGTHLYGLLRNAEEVAKGKLPLASLGVVAESERVLRVELEQPCAWFWKLCAMPCMAPLRRDLIETYGGDWTAEGHIAVTGAYTIGEWVHDDYMRLVPNPYYYDYENLGPHEILWKFGNDPTCDFAAGVGKGRVPVAGTYYLYLNANAIPDWRVRAAMLLSVDRETLAEELGNGARPAEGLVPEGISMTDGAAYEGGASMYTWLGQTYPDYDVGTYVGRCALASALMEQSRAAGSWYGSYTVYVRFNESAVNRSVAERCQADWQRVLGLRAEFVPMEVDAYAARLRTNTFDVAYLSWLPDYDDPLSFLQIMERGGDYNHSGWGDVRYNEQLKLAAGCLDAPSRDAMLLRAEEMLYEKERFAVCPLFWYGEQYAARDGLQNVSHSAAAGYHFCYAEMDSENDF